MVPAGLVTVCESRRLPAALVLARSFLARHEMATATIVVADAEILPPLLPQDDRLRLLRGRDVGGETFDHDAAVLDARSLADALVPLALKLAPVPAVWLAPDADVTGQIELPADGGALLLAASREADKPCDDGFLARTSDAADRALEWLEFQQRHLGRADAMAQLVVRFERVGVVRDVPAFLRFPGVDVSDPDGMAELDPRTRPDLAERFRGYAERLRSAASAAPEVLPAYERAADGTPLDRRLRELIARAHEEGTTGSPFEADGWSSLQAWLLAPEPDDRAGGTSRLLHAVWLQRPDLQALYPELRNEADRDGFHGWAIVHGVGEGVVPAWAAPAEPPNLRGDNAPPPAALGVNVAGYFQSELGVGEAARRVVAALDAAQVPLLAVQGPTQPPSRRGHDAPSTSTEAAVFPLNLICVNADGLPRFAREAGPGFFADRRTIGLWWWELPDFPAAQMEAFEHVDEVWVGSRYVQDAISRVSPVPVLRVPLPVIAPVPRQATREELGLPEGFLVLFVFDHNSVMERKNPIGLIEAFSRAFPEGSGASLFIKSINADLHPAAHQRLLLAAQARSDVHVQDGYVSAQDRDAMIVACDVYASLHRAEGFGLTLAEAMALRRPVVATGWSGNVDFMSQATSWLVPHTMTAVGPGNAPYAPDSEWAEPDLDAAATALREIREDPVEARRRATAGQEWIVTHHAPGVSGAAMRSRLELLFPEAWADVARSTDEAAKIPLEVLDAARRRAALGPEDFEAWGKGRALAPVRWLALRLARPQVANQQATDETIIGALGGLAHRLESLERRREVDARGSAHLAATLLAGQRSAQRRVDELSALVAARAEGGGRVDALAERIDELRIQLDECAAQLAPLTRAERARPWVDGQPFELFEHPVAGRVLGFTDAPRVPPEERYRLFEDVFRGSPERVSGLLESYVDLLRGHDPVLDVGAGRGELLGLLREAGIPATGVDLDAGMVTVARDTGLDVVVADGVEHVERLDEDSVGAITAIHVIEHLPYDVLIRFLAGAHRALRPGGVLVCETINPHAAFARKTFWVDLTHQHPIFPEAALVLARGAGFTSACFGHLRGSRDVESDRHNEDSFTLIATKNAQARK